MARVKIKGMNCQHCVAAITKALQALPGISAVKVDLAAGEATFEGEISLTVIKKAIGEIGFEVVA